MPPAANPAFNRRMAQALLREAIAAASRPPPYVLDPWEFARLLGLPTAGRAGRANWATLQAVSARAAESPPPEFVVKLEREPYRIIVYPKPAPAAVTAAASVTGVTGA